MRRPLQFGMRENPASDRRHGSRLAASTLSGSHFIGEKNAQANPAHAVASPLLDQALSSAHGAQPRAATVEKSGTNSKLLTVHEVADLLRVPVSWVYGRTRKRSLERLPGYRVGKYWRFREDEIHDWVKRQCRESHSA